MLALMRERSGAAIKANPSRGGDATLRVSRAPPSAGEGDGRATERRWGKYKESPIIESPAP